MNYESPDAQISNQSQELRVRPLTTTGIQTHIYSGTKNTAVLPLLGTILYRRRKPARSTKNKKSRQPTNIAVPDEDNGPFERLVVVHTQSKSRGINKGVVDMVSLMPVAKIENGQVFYSYTGYPFILRLTNRGVWFSKGLLKLYDLYWDQLEIPPLSPPKIISSRYSPPIAASSEAAQNTLKNPILFSIPTAKIYVGKPSLHSSLLSSSTPIPIKIPSSVRAGQIVPTLGSDKVKLVGQSRSWEPNDKYNPERDRSNTLTIPSEVPSFSFQLPQSKGTTQNENSGTNLNYGE